MRLLPALLGFALAAGAGTAGGAAPATPRPLYRDAEVLVRFHAHALDAPLLKSRLGLGTKRRLRVAGVELLEVPGFTTVESAVAVLREQPEVAAVAPNHLRFRNGVPPDDPLFGEQWGLLNTGQPNYSAGGPPGIPGADLNAFGAWDADGDGVEDRVGDGSAIVAVIDEGVDLDHEDLAANLIAGRDFVDGDDDPRPADEGEFHGTAVAGCIGALGDNGTGVAGVAWNVRIMPLRFAFDVGQEIDAIEFARANGAQIINMSYGAPTFNSVEHDAIAALADDGILVVAAAGNQDSNLDLAELGYPASYELPNLMAVAATNRQDGIASFSQHGPLTVDVAAPGLQIVTAAPGDAYTTHPDSLAGTSFAAPYVAGVAALLKMHVVPAPGVRELRARLVEGAQPGSDPANPARERVRGGRVDAERSLELVPQPSLVIRGVDPLREGFVPGRTVSVSVTLENLWRDATGVTATLSADQGVTTSGAQDFGTVDAGERVSRDFSVTVPAGIRDHRFVRFTLDIAAAGGYAARRHFLGEIGRLRDGVEVTQDFTDDLYDDFHTWHFDLPAGKDQVTFTSDAAGDVDIDLIVRRAAPAQYYVTLDTPPEDAVFVVEPSGEVRVSADAGAREVVAIDHAPPGRYYVTVVNFKRAPLAYTLRAESSITPASGGGGGGACAPMGLLILMLAGWIRRRRHARADA